MRDADATSRSGSAVSMVFDIIRWRWKIMLMIAIPLLVGAIIAIFSTPPKYDAQATVAFSPRPSSLNVGANNLPVLVTKFVPYLTSPQTVNAVAGDVRESTDTIRSGLDARIPQASANVVITMTLEDPGLAAEAANAFVARLLAFTRSDPLLSAQVVAQATTPSQPSGPSKPLLVAVALIGSLGLGFAAGLLVERARPRIRSFDDVERLAQRPLLGALPHFRAITQRLPAALSDPRVRSAVNGLRTTILRSSPLSDTRVIGVTSAVRREGKTTFSVALAASLEQLEKSVLLIEADLEHPALAKILKNYDAPKLADVLRGDTTFDEISRSAAPGRFSVLVGSADDDAAGLIAMRMPAMLEQARGLFQFIIVDLPGVFSDGDARTIAALCDSVIVLVRAGSPAATLDRALADLETVNTPVAGTVANAFK